MVISGSVLMAMGRPKRPSWSGVNGAATTAIRWRGLHAIDPFDRSRDGVGCHSVVNSMSKYFFDRI